MSFAESSDQHASYFLPGPSMLVFVFVSGVSFSAFRCAKTSDFRHALAPYILRTPQGPLIFASTVARYKIVCTFLVVASFSFAVVVFAVALCRYTSR